jgi:hypothetical protein
MPQHRVIERAGVALALSWSLIAAPAGAAPSTFSQVIGSALLCRSQLDNAYFYGWLVEHFGPSYKREGGAWWFKVEANLWGAQVNEVMVSDDSSEVVFLAAVIDVEPGKLDEMIRLQAGPRHRPQDAAKYPVREAQPGSQIVYFKDKSKIYCLKYKPLPPAQ